MAGRWRAACKTTRQDRGFAIVSPAQSNPSRSETDVFSGVLFPVFLVISIAEDEGAALLLPSFLFLASAAWMLYARFFSSATAPVKNQAAQTSVLGSIPTHSALPPATTIPVPGVGRQQVRTNELAQPPSVTEHTTRLLDNDDVGSVRS